MLNINAIAAAALAGVVATVSLTGVQAATVADLFDLNLPPNQVIAVAGDAAVFPADTLAVGII